MKIAHVMCTDAFAGVERYVADLAAAQARAGERVTVVGGSRDQMRAAIDNPRVQQVTAPSVLAVARWLNRHPDQDVIAVHMTAAEIAATLALRTSHVPVVSTRHFAAPRGSSIAVRAIAPLIRRRVRAQIAVSSYVADRLESPASVVLPGVSTVETSDTERLRVVLVAQRLEAEKHTGLALDAFATSRLGSAGWRLQIAGDGDDRTKLESAAADLGIAHAVEFLGHRNDVHSLMQHAGILLAPTPCEGVGLSVLEAMAAGLPVVAAAAGGHLETIGSVPDSMLFDPGDATQAGCMLAELARDPARRTAYGAAAQSAQRSRFTIDAHQEAVAAVYRSVL